MGTSPVGGAGEPAPVEADLTVCVVSVCDAFRFILLICAFFVSLHLMLLGLVNFVAWVGAFFCCLDCCSHSVFI